MRRVPRSGSRPSSRCSIPTTTSADRPAVRCRGARSRASVPAGARDVEGRCAAQRELCLVRRDGRHRAGVRRRPLGRFLGFMRRDYLTPRSRADVPLLRAATDWFLGYRKGPFAMYALREYIGQDNVDLAWRRLSAQHASLEPPLRRRSTCTATPGVTPESLRTCSVTSWREHLLGAPNRSSDGEDTKQGTWQVTLDVRRARWSSTRRRRDRRADGRPGRDRRLRARRERRWSEESRSTWRCTGSTGDRHRDRRSPAACRRGHRSAPPADRCGDEGQRRGGESQELKAKDTRKSMDEGPPVRLESDRSVTFRARQARGGRTASNREECKRARTSFRRRSRRSSEFRPSKDRDELTRGRFRTGSDACPSPAPSALPRQAPAAFRGEVQGARSGPVSRAGRARARTAAALPQASTSRSWPRKSSRRSLPRAGERGVDATLG